MVFLSLPKNRWIQTGILLSTLYMGMASFFYINELSHHPSYISHYYGIGGGELYNSFEWEDDIEGTHRAHEVAVKKGKDFSHKWIFLKPRFSLLGYLKLVILPIFIIWLLILISNIFIWKYRREILAKLIYKFKSIDPFIRFFHVISFILICLFLYILEIPFKFILICLGFIFLCIPLVWFIIKKIIIDLVYDIAKAIKDASK